MDALTLHDRCFAILAGTLGETGARRTCLMVACRVVSYPGDDRHPAGRLEEEFSIDIVGGNCRPEIDAKIPHIFGCNWDICLSRFEEEVVPVIKQNWGMAHCGFDPVLLGC